MPAVMDYVNFSNAIPYTKTQIARTDIREFKNLLFGLLEGKVEAPASLNIDKMKF
ncbi:hypothetical protein PDN38_27100 [Bacillus cereus]|uniref:hypothetical protein n=1 Tax=Bacillus cereus TaxID=1396 RepID=UPI0015D4BDD2|nr:hypothetical protein [Bacillus cereus]MDA2412457.1 hypothetical protein [Bacillus cereus]MDZ4434790.1 hypothetical protein [Bacillus cereus]